MLLMRIENANGELADVKREQDDLLLKLSQRNSQLDEMKR